MKHKHFSLFFLIIVIMSLLAGCVNQHTGDKTPDKPDEKNYRIAATSVATCEILDSLGVESEHVVGIPHSDAYAIPKAYENAESLGSPMAPDMEILKSLDADYVFTPNSLESELKPKYDNIGVASYFLNLKSVDGMYKSIKEIGEMLNKKIEADKLCKEYENFKNEYARQNKVKKSPRVLVLMGLPGSYVVATESSYVGSLVKLAGGENIYGDGNGQDFLNVNTEDMLSKNPDIILRTSHAMPKQVAAMFAEEFETNDIWKHFNAVKNGKVFDLDNEKFGMSATFRYKEALDDLQPILYEE